MKTKILFFLLMGYLNVYAQQITQIEYFFDTDPGFGLGYQLTEFTASSNIENLTFDVPINALQTGFHYLFVRAKDQNGKWSMVKTHTFLKEQVREIPSPNIVQIEYFIDTDPGLGLATAITGFASAATIPDLTFTIPVETLSQGIHQLQIRAKDQNDKWSIVKTHTFLKENINATSLPNIVRIEYFIDTDPGLGLATTVNGFTSATEITDYLFDVVIPSQPEGLHTLFVRAKDSNNKWSIIKTTEFNIATCSPITISPCIVPCEVNPTIINICTGQSTILYATGCVGTVTWSTGLVGTQLTVSTTGTYTALCSNFDCGSSISNEITVNINPVPTITVTTPSAQCGGTINLSTAFSSNGTLTYFTESGFSSSATNPVTSTGPYYAMAGIGSCTSTASVAITIHALPTITIQSNSPQCAGQTISLTASGGTSYSWACPDGNCPNGFVSNSATPSFVGSVSNSGTYTVTATNSNGCTATQTTSISVHALPTVTIQSNSPQCAGQTINLTASGGTSYSWACPSGNCPNGFTSTLAIPSFAANPSNSGIYTVTATNANGCTATQTTSISVHALPTVTIQSNSPQCAGQTINLTASGGNSYSWACPSGNCPSGFVSNSATPSFVGSTSNSGTYTVTATNSNDCTATQTTSVSVHALPTITIQSNSPQCAGQTINLTASGGTSYSWSCPGGNCPNGFVSNSATPSFVGSVSNSGTYTVSVTNSNGCTATQTTSLSVHALPTINVTPPPAQCGGSIDLNTVFSSNGTLTFFTESGFSSSATNPVTISGPYYALASMGTCTSTASVSITMGAAPTINVTPPPAQCGGSIDLNTVFSSNGTLTFFTESGFSSSATNPVTSTGPYYAQAGIGTCTNTASVSITINALPTVTVQSNSPRCIGAIVNLTAMGGTSYAWACPSGNCPNGFVSNSATPSFVATPSNTGIYTITATNANGCTATQTTSIPVHALPTVTIQSNSPQCAGQTINLTASGGTAYSWACPGGNCPNGFVSNSATPSFVGSASNSGTYTVTATNSNGCTATQTTSISVHALPTVTIQSNSPQCAGQTINLTASGGTSYSWACPDGNCPNGFVSNSATPSFVGSVSNSGTYTVTATNANGCTATQTTSIFVNALPTISVTLPPPAQCRGSINLNTVFSSNGTLTFFTESGFSSSATNPVTSTGPYYAKATLGICTSTASVSITIGVAPTITVIPPAVQCGGSIDLNTVFSSNGTLTYFTDSGFSSSATNPVTSTGPYYAKASISTCTSSASVAITIGTAPTLTVTTPAAVCPPNTVNLQATASSNGALSFFTDSGFSITVANPTAVAVGGPYYIKATNTANCSATASVQVSIGTHPDLPALIDLYNATNGPNWTNKTGWLSNCDPCNGWFGITCTNGRVTGINVNNNQLGGTIPATLGNLSNLQNLILNNNQLSGAIPSSLGNLSSLQNLNLNNNQLSGIIPPSLGNLSNLRYFYLSGNQLSGTIPTTLGNLSNLQYLYLYSNQLSGTIPSSLGNLSNLLILFLNNNQLSGCFPASLSALCSHLTNYNFTGNTGLPGGGSNAAWQAFCATGQGSDAFIATASTTTPSVCIGNRISLSASGGTAYTWRGPNSYTSINNAPTFNATSTALGGVYTVTVNNGGGACFKTATVQVTVNTLPSVTIANNSPVCVGQVVSMTATGGTTYTWACPNGACPVGFVSTSATPSFTATSTQGEGNYTVTVGANGCTASAKVQLNINPIPAATAETTTPNVCVGDNIRLQASGGASYSWACPTGACGFVTSTRNPVFVATNTNQSGTYTVTVANINGCTATATVSVAVNVLPVVLVSSNSPVCVGSTLQLSASGGNSYSWKGPAAFNSNVAQPTRSSITANMDGAYSVTVTNANGCTASASSSVVVSALPTLTITTLAAVCYPNTVNLQAATSSNGTLSFFTDSGFSITVANPTAVALGGTYYIKATNTANCSATASVSVSISTHPDLSALIELYNATNGPNWYNKTGWLSNCNPCSGWYGVTCTNGRVTGIDLIDNQLSGTIPATLGNLSNLQFIDLEVNQLMGNIPYSLGNLSNLQRLNLRNNQLGGTIPSSLGNLSNLQNLYLSGNQLSGTIPPELGSLNNLYHLFLDGNQLSGAIPPALGNLNSLQGLNLYFNQLSGSIPSSLGSLSNLQFLNLGVNQMSGSIPLSLGGLSSLNELVLNNNQLNGAIPSSLGSLSSLRWLDLHNNQLNGSIPSSLGSLSNLYAIFLDHNQLSGSIPSSLGNLSNLRRLILVNNQLSGCFPANLSSLCNHLVYTNAIRGYDFNFNSGLPDGGSDDAWRAFCARGQGSDAFTATASTTTSAVCLGKNISLSASGGTAYTWQGPNGYTSTNRTPTFNATATTLGGVYTVTVNNGGGACFKTATVQVTVNALPIVTVANNSSVCVGQVVNMTATGGTTYAWACPNGACPPGFVSTAATPSFIAASTQGEGNYSVTVGANGCTASAKVQLNINPTPTATAETTTPTVCVGDNIRLQASGGATYSWACPSGTCGFESSTRNPVFVATNTNQSGTYTVTVTNAIGCTATATVSVAINALPVVSVSSNSPVCVGSTLQLSASGGSSYSWKGPTAFNSNVAQPTRSSLTANMEGVYSVSVTNASGCSASGVTSVLVNTLPDASISISTDKYYICAGNTVGLSASLQAGANYKWYRELVLLRDGTANTLIIHDGGTYKVEVTNQQGCMAMTSIGMKALPAVALVASHSFIQNGATLKLSADPAGLKYSWSGPSGFTSTLRSPSISPISAANGGVYQLVGLDASSGCTASATTSVVISAASSRLGAKTATEEATIQLRIFPNPTGGKFTAEVRLQEPSSIALHWIDALGQTKQSWPFSEVKAIHRIELDVSASPEGIYLLSAETTDRKRIAKKVVKRN